jgi:hypothetical protein
MVYWGLWALCTALTGAVILVPEYLPMVDLPQHAAQIAIWLDWNDPGLEYQQVYRRSPLSPAFVSTALVFALAHLVSVELALRIVIAATAITTPIVVRLLITEVGGNPWWAFLSFPIVFGFPFAFGFINFYLGIPAALFLVLLAIRYSERPTGWRAAGLALMTVVLFAIHAVAFGFGALAAGAIILARSPGLRSAVVRTAPLILVLPVVVFWLLTTREAEASVRVPPDFRLGFYRLLVLPEFFIGARNSPLVIFLGVMMLGAPFIGGARPSRRPWRWVVLGLSLALYLGAPHIIFGTGFIFQRFAVFVVPGLVLALDPPVGLNDQRRRSRSPEIAPILTLILLIGVGVRFSRFNTEASGLNEILNQIPRGARLLYLPVEHSSAAAPFPVYLHSGMWHQVRQGGVTDFSFARFPLNQFRYATGAAPDLPRSFEFNPESFEWHRHWGDAFGYFLVRSSVDSREILFKEAVDRVTLVERRGAWWLFRRIS